MKRDHTDLERKLKLITLTDVFFIKNVNILIRYHSTQFFSITQSNNLFL